MPEYIYVSSGVTSTGINVKNNTMYVLSGGTASNTTADFGGYIFIDSYGKAFTTVVNSGGILIFLSDAFASGTTVNSGGSMEVREYAIASGVTVNKGGRLTVAYGSAVQVLENGGYVGYYDSKDVSFLPGSFSGLTLDAPATVHSGTVAARTYISDGGRLTVYSGGRATQTTVYSGGEFGVLSGGFASDTIVYDYCAVTGSMAYTTINSGGSVVVDSKGAANYTDVNPGGTLIVYDGCSALQIKENGGVVGVGLENTQISFIPNVLSGASLFNEASIHSETVLTDTTLDSKVRIYVYNGGIVSKTTLNNASASISCYGGTLDSITVSKGGIHFYSGGTLDHTTLSSGGYLFLQSATADNTMVDGGKISLDKDGTADHTTIINSGTVVVWSSGTANNTVVSAGSLALNSGTVNSTTFYDGSMSLINGATANSTFVSGGVMDVSSGTATVVKVYGGTVNVFADATATGVTALGGTVNISSGAVLNSASAQDGRIRIYSGGTAVANRATKTGRIVANAGGALVSCIAISSGRVELEGGGALATEVAAGGIMLVEGAAHPIVGKDPTLSNGIASNTRIHLGAVASVGSGGAMLDTVVGYSSASLSPKPGTGLDLPSVLLQHAGLYINSSGLANGVTASKGAIVAVGNQGMLISARVSSGASAQVMAGGSARTLNVLRGGSATISGSASTLSIASAAKAEIKDGGVASGVTVSSGGLLRADAGALVSGVSVAAGGTVTGIFAGLSSQAVTLADGILDFDISGLGEEQICVEQLNTAFAGTFSCTITVGDAQANGTYKLAGDAAGFEKTITVQNDAGENLGSLAVGGTAKIGGVDYTLALGGDNVLSVTVGAVVPEPVVVPPFLTGDFSGEGQAMFATQKDGVVKIYANGAAWGDGLALDPGWDVLASGDFNGDKMDDILRVNTEGYVVGEMSNGNGTFTPQVLNLKNAGWSIFGTGDFNHNGTDDVLIANPTGASDTVGLLGYWESGVTWTLINGYSAEWEMVATGDFNADGKCDMLWRNSFEGEGGLTYNAYCTWIVEPPAGQSDWRMVSVANPTEWNFLCSGDFNGDKMNDIAMINGEGVVGIWGVEDGWLSSWSILSAVTAEWTLAGVGDFNGDGTDDIAWSNTDTGLTGYWQINDKTLTAWANLVTIG